MKLVQIRNVVVHLLVDFLVLSYFCLLGWLGLELGFLVQLGWRFHFSFLSLRLGIWLLRYGLRSHTSWLLLKAEQVAQIGDFLLQT
jgi:hypothetical protein